MALLNLLQRPSRRIGLACVILVLLISECGLRLAGITDFPIFYVDPSLGYVPRPSQSGRFLDRNRWSFNERSMATDAAWNPASGSNLLLIGNSIVQGGNPIDQEDRLGTVLQNNLGKDLKVWPIAAGGWSNLNEVNYLRRFDDIALSADFFVWEYMAGGLSEVSKWRGEYLTPTSHPWLASWYVTRRYILPRFIDLNETELPPTGAVTQENLAQFDAMLTKLSERSRHTVPGIIFLYPESCRLSMARLGDEWLPERSQVETVAARHGIMVVDIARDPTWTAKLYRDAVHPTVEGNQVLARILTNAVQAAMLQQPSAMVAVPQKAANASPAHTASGEVASTC